MDSVKVTGTFPADAFFQTMGRLVAAKQGMDITLISREYAGEWVNVFHRVQQAEKRPGA